MTSDGWTIYSTKPDPDGWMAKIRTAATTIEDDCRAFARAAQQGKAAGGRLWRHFSPTWEDFCRDHLDLDPDYVGMVLQGAMELCYGEMVYGWPSSLPVTAQEAVLAALEKP